MPEHDDKETKKTRSIFFLYIGVVLALHVLYIFFKNLWVMYLFAVAGYYVIFITKIFIKRRAGKHECKTPREATIKSVMPWLNGFVFAFGAVGVLYFIFSQGTQAAWLNGVVLSENLINLVEYAMSFFIISMLLWAFQKHFSKYNDEDDEECSNDIREHKYSKVEKTR